MLSSKHFYYRTTRKMVIAFGTMFNNIRLVRYNNAGTTEIERVNVPLTYASKEKFYSRITQDPNLSQAVNITLPKMSFEMSGISYDPLRKISNNIDQFKDITTDSMNYIYKFKMTPYNYDFNLNIFVRNNEDGLQIVEQILPYFTPDYSVTVDFLGVDGYKLDVPIVFNNISTDNQYEGGPDETRIITWSLNFTMKSWLFGPMDQHKLIRKSTANTYDNTFETADKQTLTFSTGTGEFKIGELVYQGTSLDEATATAYVSSWNSVANTLVVVDTNGTLAKNTITTGFVSGAKYNVNGFNINTNNQLYNLTVVPSPSTANIIDDFGFSTTNEEWPSIT